VTRDQLIETMKRAINHEIGDGDVSLAASQRFANRLATAALKAIEAAGMRVVPVEPSEAVIRAVDAACHDHWPNARKMAVAMHAVIIAAAQEDSTSE
jgi:hypothetical protein